MQNNLTQSQTSFQNKAYELEKSLSNQTSLLFGQYLALTKSQYQIEFNKILEKKFLTFRNNLSPSEDSNKNIVNNCFPII